jgi:hypothetical protein
MLLSVAALVATLRLVVAAEAPSPLFGVTIPEGGIAVGP